MTYTVLDTHSGRVVRVYAATRKLSAYNFIIEMNRIEGAVRFIVRPEPVKQPEPGSVLAVGPL